MIEDGLSIQHWSGWGEGNQRNRSSPLVTRYWLSTTARKIIYTWTKLRLCHHWKKDYDRSQKSLRLLSYTSFRSFSVSFVLRRCLYLFCIIISDDNNQQRRWTQTTLMIVINSAQPRGEEKTTNPLVIRTYSFAVDEEKRHRLAGWFMLPSILMKCFERKATRRRKNSR